MKINPEGVELFYEDGQTDRQTDRRAYMTKLWVAFYNYAIVVNNSFSLHTNQLTFFHDIIAVRSENHKTQKHAVWGKMHRSSNFSAQDKQA